jgi:MFS family permease
MLAIGFAFFGIWSAITGFSAFSRSSIFFDFCRAMQGVGPAICLPNAVAILGRSYPPGHRKNIAFAMFAACAPVSAFISVDVALTLSRTDSWSARYLLPS